MIVGQVLWRFTGGHQEQTTANNDDNNGNHSGGDQSECTHNRSAKKGPCDKIGKRAQNNSRLVRIRTLMLHVIPPTNW